MNSKLADQHIQARNFTNTNGRRVDLVVMHTDEANERPDNAENVARFFATTDRDASAHYCCDNNSIVSCVDEMDVAFGAPHVNHNGVHIEQSGDAAQRPADWADDFSQTMLKEQVAPLVADIATRHGIPIRHLTNDELRRGLRGVVGHVQASQVFGGTHTDPGASYPWGLLISRAKAIADTVVQDWRFVLLDGEGKKLEQSGSFKLSDRAAAWSKFTTRVRPVALSELADADSGRDISIRQVRA